MKKPPLNARGIAWWEKTRRKGKTHFIVCWGILGWGLLSGLLDSLIHYFFFGSDRSSMMPWLVTFPAAGIFYGYWMWTFYENAYKSYLSQKELAALDELSANP